MLSDVLQGSVPGLILFLVFFNNLDVLVELVTKIRKFASDTKLRQAMRTDQDRELVQTAWAETCGMAFNIKQCMVMQLGHKNPQYPLYAR
jgi:mannose/fructose/N-acetylgalactosamine-specific phosphotransferase system component IID